MVPRNGQAAAYVTAAQSDGSMIMAEPERETIITTDGGGGGGSVVAIVAIVLVLLVVLFFLFGRGMLNGEAPTKTIKADIDVNLPSTGGNSN